jgi:hypothetical protein
LIDNPTKALRVLCGKFFMLPSYKINRPPLMRWAIGSVRKCVNLAGFAQRPEADYHYRYYYWRRRSISFLLQVGGIIAQSCLEEMPLAEQSVLSMKLL